MFKKKRLLESIASDGKIDSIVALVLDCLPTLLLDMWALGLMEPPEAHGVSRGTRSPGGLMGSQGGLPMGPRPLGQMSREPRGPWREPGAQGPVEGLQEFKYAELLLMARCLILILALLLSVLMWMLTLTSTLTSSALMSPSILMFCDS